MFVCDDRCRECRSFDWDAQCCGYLYKHSEKTDDKSRGRVVRRRNGRRVIVYANPCDKFEPCDGTANAPGSINFESGPVKRKKDRPRCRTLKDFPERNELYRRGLTDEQMAERLGLKPTGIRNWRNKRGLPMNGAAQGNHGFERPGCASHEIHMALYERGLTDRQMAERLGISTGAANSWRLRRNLEKH